MKPMMQEWVDKAEGDYKRQDAERCWQAALQARKLIREKLGVT